MPDEKQNQDWSAERTSRLRISRQAGLGMGGESPICSSPWPHLHLLSWLPRGILTGIGPLLFCPALAAGGSPAVLRYRAGVRAGRTGGLRRSDRPLRGAALSTWGSVFPHCCGILEAEP